MKPQAVNGQTKGQNKGKKEGKLNPVVCLWGFRMQPVKAYLELLEDGIGVYEPGALGVNFD